MTDQEPESIALLRSEFNEKIAGLREELKERESSVLGAVRTFAQDVWAWRRGARDFPMSATIGLTFAYLRPRVILAVGSVAALVIAAAQIWLIKGQNEILFEQGRMLKAQTIGTIVQELRRQDPTAISSSALITAFGDVSFEFVYSFVLPTDPPYPELSARGQEELNGWINAALIVSRHPKRLSDHDTIKFRYRMTELLTNLHREQQELGERLKDNGPIATADRESADALARYAHTVRNTLHQLNTERPPDRAAYMSLSDQDKADLISQMKDHYNEFFSGDPKGFIRTTIDPVDDAFTEICSAMGGKTFQSDLAHALVGGAEDMEKRYSAADRSHFVRALTDSWCGLPASGVHELPEFDVVHEPRPK
ncbi:MAG: hypothetical protein ABW171_05445 [Steroidobacter sp.]